MEEKELINLMVLCGVSGSGKSTIAHAMYETNKNWLVVSSDEVRKELYGDENCQDNPAKVFEIVHQRTRKALRAGTNVIVDATNLTIKNRRPIIECARGIENIYVSAVVCAVPIEECIKRDNDRARTVGQEVIKRQVVKFQLPLEGEGFNEIILMNDAAQKKTMGELMEIMKGFDQKNPHHSLPLDEHVNSAAKYITERGGDLDFGLYFAAALHDIGKPFTQVFHRANGEVSEEAHYFGHAEYGAYLALTMDWQELDEVEAVRNLRYYIGQLICYHMIPYSTNTNKSIKRWKDRCGDSMWRDLTLLHEADKLAH